MNLTTSQIEAVIAGVQEMAVEAATRIPNGGGADFREAGKILREALTPSTAPPRTLPQLEPPPKAEPLEVIPADQFKPGEPPKPPAERGFDDDQKAFLRRFAHAQRLATSTTVTVELMRDGQPDAALREHLASLGWVSVESKPGVASFRPKGR